jgi:hypothetical protein
MIAKTDLFGLPPSRNQGERAAGSVPRPALQACRQAEPGPRLHSYVRACGLGCSTVSVVARADYEGPMAESFDAGRTLTPEAIATWRDVLAPLLGSGSFPVLDLGAGTARFSAIPIVDSGPPSHQRRPQRCSGQPPRPGTTRYASCTNEDALFGTVSDQDDCERWFRSYRVIAGTDGPAVDNRAPRAPLARLWGWTPRRRSMSCPSYPHRRPSPAVGACGPVVRRDCQPRRSLRSAA